MLNILHLPPILFLQKILIKDDKSAICIVGFESIPTLGMMMEAAAQSSSVFSSSKSEGYVLSASNLTLHEEPKKLILEAHISLIMQSDNLNEIYFEIKDEATLYSSGKLLVMLPLS